MRLLRPGALPALIALVLAGAASSAMSHALDSVKVSNTAGPVKSGVALQASHRYRLVVTGTVSDWCTTSSCPAGDATKTAQPNVGVDGVWCYAKWRCPTPEAWQQLQVNGQGILDFTHQTADDVPYSPGHSYTFELTGVSGKLTLDSSDALGSSSDNSGSFNVTITDLGGAGGGGASAPASTGPVPSPTRAEQLQLLLAQLGYYNGPLDGKLGPATIAALKRAQHELGLPADGKCDDDTCLTKLERALRSEEPAADSGVRDLQENLARLGYYNGPIDGKDGPLLQAALKRFQAQAGVTADGKCDDDACQKKVEQALGTGATPAQQSIVDLQEGLKRLGLYNGPVDGKDGPQLQAALKRFQAGTGQPADQACDDACRAALTKSLALDDPELSPGASPVTSKTVENLQADLHALGLYKGPLDGKPDASVTAAIKAFQQSAGLRPDGNCGLQCQLALVKALGH